MESLEHLMLPSPLKKIAPEIGSLHMISGEVWSLRKTLSKYILQANLLSILLSDFAFLILEFLSCQDVFKLVNISHEVRNEPKTFSNIINLYNKHYISFFNYYFNIIIKEYNAERVYFMLQFEPEYLDEDSWVCRENKIITIDRPLFSAIKKNLPLDIISKLIDLGSTLDFEDFDEESPLNIAVECGNFNTVKLLIEKHNVNIHHQDEYNKNSLILAAENGHQEIVKFLLSRETINVNFQSNYENTDKRFGSGTALFRASENGHQEIVLLLINAGADLSLGFRTTDDGYYSDAISPLQIAIFAGKTEIVDILIKNGADVNYPTYINTDINNKNELVNEYFSTTPFMDACKNGNSEMVKMLIKAGANTSYSFYFTEYDNTRILHSSFKYAIERDESPDKTDILKQLIDLEHSLISFLEVLFTFDEDNIEDNTDNYGKTLQIITNIIYSRKNINYVDNHGNTALLIAASNGYFDLVKLLVEAGANIEFIDNDGNNAIFLSEKNGYNDINVYLQIQIFNRLFF